MRLHERQPNPTLNATIRVIVRSDKSQTSPFQDWVAREALPAIKKHGVYLSKGNAYAGIIIQDAIKG